MSPQPDSPSRQLTELDLASSPRWLPLDVLERESVRFVALDEEAYRVASFLDQRILQGEREQAVGSSQSARVAAATLSSHSHYIFHIGHVGSTLVSRLIGEHESFFAVREPAILRPLAEAAAQSGTQLPQPVLGLDVLLPLLARTWRPHQRAVIKATSFVSELAPAIFAGTRHSAAVFMYTTPVAYLCNILAGSNSRLEARRLAPMRLRRLVKRLGDGDWRPGAGSEGEHIAMSWLCEMASLQHAWQSANIQVLWVDFDTFLREPLSGLEAIFRTLGATPDSRGIETLVTGPLMRQYSKAPEHGYDADLRRRVLQSAEQEHPVEIRRGMDWLRRMAGRFRLVEALLQ